jgi:hypothetical protein
MTVSAVKPWRTAFRRDRSLPSGVIGPVLFCALRRLASICLNEVVKHHLQELASFWCAPKARVTSGGGFRPENCRLIW